MSKESSALIDASNKYSLAVIELAKSTKLEEYCRCIMETYAREIADLLSNHVSKDDKEFDRPFIIALDELNLKYGTAKQLYEDMKVNNKEANDRMGLLEERLVWLDAAEDRRLERESKL